MPRRPRVRDGVPAVGTTCTIGSVWRYEGDGDPYHGFHVGDVVTVEGEARFSDSIGTDTVYCRRESDGFTQHVPISDLVSPSIQDVPPLGTVTTIVRRTDPGFDYFDIGTVVEVYEHVPDRTDRVYVVSVDDPDQQQYVLIADLAWADHHPRPEPDTPDLPPPGAPAMIIGSTHHYHTLPNGTRVTVSSPLEHTFSTGQVVVRVRAPQGRTWVAVADLDWTSARATRPDPSVLHLTERIPDATAARLAEDMLRDDNHELRNLAARYLANEVDHLSLSTLVGAVLTEAMSYDSTTDEGLAAMSAIPVNHTYLRNWLDRSTLTTATRPTCQCGERINATVVCTPCARRAADAIRLAT